MDASVISTALISLFFLFIIMGFAVGWVRGLNKSLVRILLVLVMAVVAFFIVPPITEQILRLDISKFNLVIAETPVMTVQDFILEAVRKIAFVEDIVDASPTFETFIQVIPQMLVNVVLFVVFFFILKWVSMIIYWIISGICFSKKKTAGKDKHAFIGAVVGALQGLVVAIMVFVPVFGIIDTAKPVVKAIRAEAQTENAENGEEAQEKNDAITDVIDTYGVYYDAADNNWVFKVLGAVGLRQLSDAMYDGLTTIKVDGTSYGLRREVKTIAGVYPDFRTVTNGGFNIRSKETLDSLKNIINKLYESPVLSGMIREIIPSVAERWSTPQDETGSLELDFCGVKKPMFDNGGSVDKMFDALLKNLAAIPADSDTIKNDLITGIELIELCNDNGILDVVAGDKDIMDVLNNHPEGEDGIIVKIINKALESETFKAVLPDVIDVGLNYVYKVLEVEVKDAVIGQVGDDEWANETHIIQRVFTNIYNVYDQVGKGGDPMANLDFELLGQVFDDMRQSILLKDSSIKIMDALFESKVIFGDNVDSDIVKKFKTSLDAAWAKEPPVSFAATFKSLGDALKIARDMKDAASGGLDLNNLKDVVKQLNDNKEVLGDVIKDVLDKDMLDSLGVGEAAGVVSDVLDSIIHEDYDEEAGKSIEKEIEAAEQLLDAANSVLAAGDGKADIEDTDSLVEKLADSSVLLDKLTEEGKTATQDLLKDEKGESKLSEDTLKALEQSIESKGGNEETKNKLKELFGIQ